MVSLSTYHWSPKALCVFFQFLDSVICVLCSIDNFACFALADILKNCPQLIACRRLFGDVELEIGALKLVLVCIWSQSQRH